MPSPIFISRPPAGFSLLAVVRGLQLTVVGGYRALKNPDLSKTGYYRKAFNALIWSMVIQLSLWAPLVLFRWTLLFSQYISGYEDSETESTIQTLRFWQNALNIGPLLISGVRYVRPEMDDLFLVSLRFVDKVYKQKHPESDREYYPNLVRYENEYKETDTSLRHRDNLSRFLQKYGYRAMTTIAMYFLSGMPLIGRFVLPVVSFYSLNGVVGTPTATTIFSIGLFAPRKMLVLFLAAFWGGRSLSRELLSPYFNRVPFSKAEKDQWFGARDGIMFGFGAGFYMLLKIPFIGVLVYGFAEASAAYLITKVSDPPPPPEQLYNWTAAQTIWTRKDYVLSNNVFDDEF